MATAETYSFLTLREVIDAKIARKLSLQAEIHQIEQELAEAIGWLQQIPSLAATPAHPAHGVPPAPAPVPRRSQPVEKTCARCPAVFTGTKARTLCRDCFKRMCQERAVRARAQRKTNGVRLDHRLLDQIDARIGDRV